MGDSVVGGLGASGNLLGSLSRGDIGSAIHSGRDIAENLGRGAVAGGELAAAGAAL